MHLDTEENIKQPISSSLPEDMRISIRPVVRNKKWIVSTTRLLKEAGIPKTKLLVQGPLVADLYVVYKLCPRPKAPCYMNEEDRIEIGLTHDEIYKVAIDNLRKPASRAKCEKHGPIQMLVWERKWDVSCLLLVTELWQKLKKGVRGELLAAVPSGDILLYAGSGSTGAVRCLRNSVLDMSKAAESVLSENLYKWTGQGWAVF